MTDTAAYGVVVPSPSAMIAVRRVSAIHGAIVTVAGDIGDEDAAVLHHCLHHEIELAPTVLVIDLAGVTTTSAAGLLALSKARIQAPEFEVALHLLDRGRPTVQRLLADADLT